MTPPIDQAEISVALQAVRRGALLARSVQRDTTVDAVSKSDRSPVTVADFAVQALISAHLEQAFPEDSLVGEESATFLRSDAGRDIAGKVVSRVKDYIKDADAEKILGWIDRGAGECTDRFWALDPIDGTKGFLRGDHYAIALALIEGGAVKIGVLGCPQLTDGKKTDKHGRGSLVLGVKGKGAWVSSLEENAPWKALRVSHRSHVKDIILFRSFEKGHTHGTRIDRVKEMLGMAHPVLRMDSLAKYAVLAAGGGDVLCRIPTPQEPDRKEWIWDQAAGALVVEEAGGRVSDIDGEPLDFSCGKLLTRNRGILATNNVLHDQVLRAIKNAEEKD